MLDCGLKEYVNDTAVSLILFSEHWPHAQRCEKTRKVRILVLGLVAGSVRVQSVFSLCSVCVQSLFSFLPRQCANIRAKELKIVRIFRVCVCVVFKKQKVFSRLLFRSRIEIQKISRKVACLNLNWISILMSKLC